MTNQQTTTTNLDTQAGADQSSSGAGDSAPKSSAGRFVKGTSGNPAGRPPGTRNQATVMMEGLLEGDAEALTRKAIELASAGDVNALRLCVSRLLPPRKDVSAAMSSAIQAIAESSEGETMTRILMAQANLLTSADMDRRVKDLEAVLLPATGIPSAAH